MNDEQKSFTIGNYTVKQVSKLGLWLVQTEHLFDLGMLFLRVQEFYECASPDFHSKAFRLLDYMRWYVLNVSDDGSFSYFSDFEGFNIPSDALEEALSLQNPDPNNYDLLMSQIFAQVKALQHGPFYLIGARNTDVSVYQHEMAHGMFHLMPDYRAKMTKMVNELPERAEIQKSLAEDGYGEAVMVDEIQAYLATGLYNELIHLEHVRHPFMTAFAAAKKKLIKQPRKPKLKEAVCPAKTNI